jgi:hypothetical protein
LKNAFFVATLFVITISVIVFIYVRMDQVRMPTDDELRDSVAKNRSGEHNSLGIHHLEYSDITPDSTWVAIERVGIFKRESIGGKGPEL